MTDSTEKSGASQTRPPKQDEPKSYADAPESGVILAGESEARKLLREARDALRFALWGGRGPLIPRIDAFLATPEPEPVAWVRAIDEALMCSHLGVANASDSYEEAKRKINILLAHEQSIGAYFAEQDAAPKVPK